MRTVFETYRTSSQILRQGHTAQAFLLATLSLLLGALIGFGPIALGVWFAIQGEWLTALLLPLGIYLALGFFAAFWPILAVIWFIVGWREGGLLYGLLSTLIGSLVIFILVSGPDWLMYLANRSAEKADSYDKKLREAEEIEQSKHERHPETQHAPISASETTIQVVTQVPAARVPRAQAVAQLAILTVLTIGLYLFRWFYRTCNDLKSVGGSQFSPGLRTLGLLVPIVNLFILYNFFDQIRTARSTVGLTRLPNAGWMLVAVIFCGGLWRLPDAWGLLGLTLLLPLTITQGYLNELWVKVDGTTATRKWSRIHIAIVVIALVVGGLAVYGTLYGSDEDSPEVASSIPNVTPPHSRTTTSDPSIQIRFPSEEIALNLVREFHSLIHAREYRLAYSMLGAEWQREMSYDKFEQGFANTDKSNLVDSSVDYVQDGSVQVRAIIEAFEYRNTQWSRYEARYIIRWDESSWKIVSGRLRIIARRSP